MSYQSRFIEYLIVLKVFFRWVLKIFPGKNRLTSLQVYGAVTHRELIKEEGDKAGLFFTEPTKFALA